MNKLQIEVAREMITQGLGMIATECELGMRMGTAIISKACEIVENELENDSTVNAKRFLSP